MRDSIQGMTMAKALGIVQEIVQARKRWGKGVSVPYTQDQLYDALVVMEAEGLFTGVTDADVTKLRRQLAACENREKARKNAKSDSGTSI